MNRADVLSEVSGMITGSRNVTHGDPQVNLTHATALKDVLRNSPRFHELVPAEREALEQIMTKASRLCCGNHDIDSWKDIAGFAAIGAEARSQVAHVEVVVRQTGYAKGRKVRKKK